MKKVISLIMAAAFLVSAASCSVKKTEETTTSGSLETKVTETSETSEVTEPSEEVKGNSFDDIKLTQDIRSWTNGDERFSELAKRYGDLVCAGTMAVATDDDIIYLFSENVTEKDGKTLESQDTVFDMGSVSKTFTAVCVLQLMEQGKLSLDDALNKYFPDYETGKKITINDLLHMRSGIPDYNSNPDPFWNISGADAANKLLSDVYMDKITDEEFLQALFKAPLGFEPGSKFEYSNSNYHILAFIVEQVSGMKFCDYIKENIFDKCGMTKTSSMAIDDMTYVPVEFEDLVKYNFSKDGYPGCPRNTRGDSGIHSSVKDMIAFDRALFAGELLGKEAMEIMLKDEDGYCCGLMKEKDGYYHDGSSFTCNTSNRIIESDEYGHIYMVKLERDKAPLPNTGSGDPMVGTGFIKGETKDGVYTNECAEVKIKVPEGFTVVPENECDVMMADAIQNSNDDEEKNYHKSLKFDCFFWNKGDSLQLYFMNTALAAPDDDDYTEEEFLEDEFSFMENETYEITRKGVTKVTLGGKEYTRSEVEISLDDMKLYTFTYGRKINDNLMLDIDITITDPDKIDEFEKLFMEY